MPQRPRDETIVYSDTLKTEDRSERIILRADGFASVAVTERKTAVRTSRVVPVVALGIAGALIVLFATFGALPDVFLGAGKVVPYLSGIAAMVSAMCVWRALHYKVMRASVQTPLDHPTLDSLKRLKGLRGVVTDDLLTAVHTLATIEQAQGDLNVAKERSRIGGPSPRLQRQEEESRMLIETHEVVRDEALGALLEKVAEAEDSQEF